MQNLVECYCGRGGIEAEAEIQKSQKKTSIVAERLVFLA
jgi:hypothetical protein